MSDFIAFSLEGPLSSRNMAAELLKMFQGGEKILGVLQRYSELSAKDVQALIVPLLVLHNIREEQIVDLASQAPFTEGAAKLVSQLEYDGWKICCLTATFEQYALRIAQKLGIYSHHVACTPLPLSEIYRVIDRSELDLILHIEKEITEFTPGPDDPRIKSRLDRFFNEQLPKTNIALFFDKVQPISGVRRLEALKSIVTEFGQPLSKWVIVGSGRDDSQALRAVNEAGGLSIAFNAEKDSLAQATLALASINIGDLTEVVKAWQRGSRKNAEKLVKEKEKTAGIGNRGFFSWLSGDTDLSSVIAQHGKTRQLLLEKETT